jgi:hypothetical protein
VTWWARALLFSGRPDPTWELSSAEQQALTAAWSRLPPTGSVEAIPPAALGYRGIEIIADEGGTWVAAGGLVTLTATGEPMTRLDSQRTVEHMVLATAPPGLLPPGSGPAPP